MTNQTTLYLITFFSVLINLSIANEPIVNIFKRSIQDDGDKSSRQTIDSSLVDSTFQWEPYTECLDPLDWNRAQKSATISNWQDCLNSCSNTDGCLSFQWNGKKASCVHMQYRIQSIGKVTASGAMRMCGVKEQTNTPTTSPSITPSSAPTYDPDLLFDLVPYTQCLDTIKWKKAQRFDNFKNGQECISHCTKSKSCLSFEWNGKKKICIIMSYYVNNIYDVQPEGPSMFCVNKNKITQPPSSTPSISPSTTPSKQPSLTPTSPPSLSPSNSPTTSQPTESPTSNPTSRPSFRPSILPSLSRLPSFTPSLTPSQRPSTLPSSLPSTTPSKSPTPSVSPSSSPSNIPSSIPSMVPTNVPSASPSDLPSRTPSVAPSDLPSSTPSMAPTTLPSISPSDHPSRTPSVAPSGLPSSTPSMAPTSLPSVKPSSAPSVSFKPSTLPSSKPSAKPSSSPSSSPSSAPTLSYLNYFQMTKYTICNPKQEWGVTRYDYSLKNMRECLRLCIHRKKVPCRSFEWDAKASTCKTIERRVGVKALEITTGKISVCGVLKKETPKPTPAPTLTPSLKPSLAPSTSPSISAFPTTSFMPTSLPSIPPSVVPSTNPSSRPSNVPSISFKPSTIPSSKPSAKPTSSPSSSPTSAPTLSYLKHFQMTDYTICNPNQEWGVTRKNSVKNIRECLRLCIHRKIAPCRSFEWDEKTRTCKTIERRIGVKALKNTTGKNTVCGVLKNTAPTRTPSLAPTPGPSPKPTRSPSNSPTDSSKPKECTLSARLGHPYNDPNDAPYYGYHSDILRVTKDNDISVVCSARSKRYDILPDWCTYSNTNEQRGDSAYIENVDDDSYNKLEKENIQVYNAAGHTYVFDVEHYFLDEDYYTNLEKWKDHMLAAELVIYNLSNEEQGKLKKGPGWKHPTDINVSTHIKKNGQFFENPSYQGHFIVTVSCSKLCWCSWTYEVL